MGGVISVLRIFSKRTVEMTRWARKEKVTGSQKRVPEEGSSWKELSESVGDEDAAVEDDNEREPEDQGAVAEADDAESSDDDLANMIANLTGRTPQLNDQRQNSFQFQRQDNSQHNNFQRQDNPHHHNNFLDDDAERKKVFFEGSWLTHERRDELVALRSRLLKEGQSQEAVEDVIRRGRRRDERQVKIERRKLCFRCREPGHMLSACPAVESESSGGGICFKCGSPDHTSRMCRAKRGLGGAAYPLATCFVCKEVGHISRECPDNPRGLYPHGGSCRVCNDVTHFARDCPTTKGSAQERGFPSYHRKEKKPPLMSAPRAKRVKF